VIYQALDSTYIHSFTRIGAEVQILDDLASLILCNKLIKGRCRGAVISKIIVV
jgi:hypothetical protein